MGAHLNYVYAIPLEEGTKLFVGSNIFAFQEKLADDRFMPDPDIDVSQLENTKDFRLQFSPALRLRINKFSIGLAVENAIDLNLSDSGNSKGSSRFTGTLSNDFPVFLFSWLDNGFVRPVVYVR